MPTDGGDPGESLSRPPRLTRALTWLRVGARQALGDLVLDPRRGPRVLLLGGLSSAVLAGSLPGLTPLWAAGGASQDFTLHAHSVALLDEAESRVEPPSSVLPSVTPPPASTPAPTAASDPRAWAVAALLRGMPLEGYAQEMVSAADNHGIDWRLLPVIAYLESQGGLTACGGNAWGYAKCEVRFASFEEGIEASASVLAQYGNLAPATAFCIWVSGDGCTTRHAVDYAYRAAGLYSRLGGQMWLPAYPPEEAVAAEAPPGPAPQDPAPADTTTPSAETQTPTPGADLSPQSPGTTPRAEATEGPPESTPTLAPVAGD